jgi:hypothetical protein
VPWNRVAEILCECPELVEFTIGVEGVSVTVLVLDVPGAEEAMVRLHDQWAERIAALEPDREFMDPGTWQPFYQSIGLDPHPTRSPVGATPQSATRQ